MEKRKGNMLAKMKKLSKKCKLYCFYRGTYVWRNAFPRNVVLLMLDMNLDKMG